MALLFAACGSAELDEPDGDGSVTTQDDGPRVADARFDGEFVATTLARNGQEVPLTVAPIVIFETRFGALTVNPGCNTYFGSFTLAEDGGASFTIAGGSRQDCGDLNEQEELLLSALRGAASWVAVDDGFTFDGANGSVTVIRA